MQQTEEWFNARLGKVTASRVSDIITTTKSGYSASRKNYMMQLLCERLTGKKDESYSNAAMEHGVETEPLARSEYESRNGVLVQTCGFFEHSSINGFGASPDGLVNDNGLLEIKCPNTATHVDFLQHGKIPIKYKWQMYAQMECTGRKWCDYVSFDNRLPYNLSYASKRLFFDEEQINLMKNEINKFLTELNKLEYQLGGFNGISE